jgi:hypothetical protein
MFFLSLKISGIKIAAFLAALAVVAAAACWEGRDVRTAAEMPAPAVSPASQFDASTNSGRIAFLKSFGWNVSSNPTEVVEVIIPQSFDAVYLNYNEIQKSQGYNLELYKGVRVKRWTYDISNYPGATGVRANLLVYNGAVIGGDVSSVALDGFMQGFSAKAANAPTGIKPSQADIVSEMLNTSAKT